jgi:hypothetical protein
MTSSAPLIARYIHGFGTRVSLCPKPAFQVRLFDIHPSKDTSLAKRDNAVRVGGSAYLFENAHLLHDSDSIAESQAVLPVWKYHWFISPIRLECL